MTLLIVKQRKQLKWYLIYYPQKGKSCLKTKKKKSCIEKVQRKPFCDLRKPNPNKEKIL